MSIESLAGVAALGAIIGLGFTKAVKMYEKDHYEIEEWGIQPKIVHQSDFVNRTGSNINLFQREYSLPTGIIDPKFSYIDKESQQEALGGLVRNLRHHTKERITRSDRAHRVAMRTREEIWRPDPEHNTKLLAGGLSDITQSRYWNDMDVFQGHIHGRG